MKTVGKPAIQQVSDTIREQIILHELKPGTRITEQEICEEYHVGRSTVRNALASLAQTGLVELIPNVGARVRVFSREQVVALMEAKNDLIMHALGKTIDYYFVSDYQVLNSIIADGNKGVADRDILSYLKASEAFNNYLVDKVGNMYLSQAFHSLTTANTIYHILYDRFYDLTAEDFATRKYYPLIVESLKERDLASIQVALEEIARIIILRHDMQSSGTEDHVYSALFS